MATLHVYLRKVTACGSLPALPQNQSSYGALIPNAQKWDKDRDI